jgi:acetamidase/formamidase
MDKMNTINDRFNGICFFSIPVAITIQSGDTVSFSCLDASNGQITKDSTVSSISSMIFSQLDQANGPVYVRGHLQEIPCKLTFCRSKPQIGDGQG